MNAELLATWFSRLAPDNQVGSAPESDSAGAGDAGQAAGASRAAGSHAEVRDTLLLSVARQAMACEFEVLLNQHQHAAAAEHAIEALNQVEQLESLLSVYQPRSDLSSINRFASERPITVAWDTWNLLQLAIDIHDLTGGTFDVTAGSLSEAWGFSRRQGRMPSEEEVSAALALVGTEYLTLDAAQRSVRLERSGVRVNPGGIGKGYALDRAAQGLGAAGVENFMMHGGLSSVVARGNRLHRATGGGWLVALKHPWRFEEQLGTVRLRNQALGTSGSGKQFFHYGGQRYSHIIDPRSGWPAQTTMSVTVICPSCAVADALATALFVMGPEPAREFCKQHQQLAAIVVFADPRSGKTSLEAYNTTDDMWMPARSVS